MAVFHDEVEIEDFQYDEDSETYFYPCPCGDNFCITKEDLENGEDVATCPSCSLIIKVIYDKVMISRFLGLSPAAGYVLKAQSLEPVSDSVSPSLFAPPPLVCALPPSLSLSLSLSLSKINK
uniref:Diphthamide biosynthesis protein 3 n=1 Tax=Felis catus TaxID=9685 RepID=A0ABI8A1Q6_FELCA